jgi:class 3 adenylate cyclase
LKNGMALSMISEMFGRAPKAGVLPLSVFGALLVSATRTIHGHPGLRLPESGRRTRSEGSRAAKDGCRRAHCGAQAAAILAADVAVYSRLVAMDEEGTLVQLKGHRQAVDPRIEEHRGRIVKTTGDGMLVEFASVVDAVRRAVEVQRGMSERNVEVSVDRRIEFGFGIHLGDIIIVDDMFTAMARILPLGLRV